MRIDAKLAKLLSSYTLDISKAFFIAAFITPQLNGADLLSAFLLLTRNLINAILFLIASWRLLKMSEK